MTRSWALAFLCILLVVYGQLIFRWQASKLGELPDSWGAAPEYIWSIARNGWVWSSLIAAVLAAACWWAAMTELELSRAYPITGLALILVLLGSSIFLGESLSASRIIGTVFVSIGVVLAVSG